MNHVSSVTTIYSILLYNCNSYFVYYLSWITWETIIITFLYLITQLLRLEWNILNLYIQQKLLRKSIDIDLFMDIICPLYDTKEKSEINSGYIGRHLDSIGSRHLSQSFIWGHSDWPTQNVPLNVSTSPEAKGFSLIRSLENTSFNIILIFNRQQM